MMGFGTRELIVSEYRVTGLRPDVIAELIAAIGPLWSEHRQAARWARPRQRTSEAGAKPYIRLHGPAAGYAGQSASWHLSRCADLLVRRDRSTTTRAIGEVRPRMAHRGRTVAADIRLRSLADVITHQGAEGQTAIVDDAEIRVRRPAADRKHRDKSISSKTKQDAGAHARTRPWTATLPHGVSKFERARKPVRSRWPGAWASTVGRRRRRGQLRNQQRSACVYCFTVVTAATVSGAGPDPFLRLRRKEVDASSVI